MGCIFVVGLGAVLRTSMGVSLYSALIGGLKQVASRITLDYVSLVLIAIATFLRTSKTKGSFLAVALAFSVGTAGSSLTNRWPLTFPVLASVALQALCFLPPFQADFPKRILDYLASLCLLVSLSLCILFPATEIPGPTGKHNVGMVDFFLPVNLAAAYTGENATCADTADGFVSARLLYPTSEKPEQVPYLKPNIALQYLKMTMKFASPPPLDDWSWLIHNWQLAYFAAKPFAEPISVDGGLPLIVYSHGLGGHSMVYMYQNLMLASHGNVVLQINHSDGSAALVERKDGSLLSFDFSTQALFADGKATEEYVFRRREQADHRVVEMLASVLALQNLNNKDIEDLKGVSFVNKLKSTDVTVMGHSFGGTTALAAAFRRPELVTSMIGHEPVADWLPDDARRALFPVDVMEDCPIKYDGGTGGLAADVKPTAGTIKDFDVLFLLSRHWFESEQIMGRGNIIHWMYTNGKMCRDCTAEFALIRDSAHNEFSDSCMMTPVWLARALNVTGKRNPQQTAEEISKRTLGFLDTIRLQKSEAVTVAAT